MLENPDSEARFDGQKGKRENCKNDFGFEN